MIKRLVLRSQTVGGIKEWPEPDKQLGDHLMAERKPLRKIVVMIDHELMSDEPSSALTEKQRILSGLLDNGLVRLFRYSDNGPPSNVPPRDGEPLRYDGWVVLTGQHPTTSDWGVIYCETAKSYSLGAVMGNAVEVAINDTRTDAYSDLTASDVAARRTADCLAAQVASQALQPDLYVTERSYLHAAKWNIAQGVTLCTVDEALALLGLYFRCQGEYPIDGGLKYNRGLFYLVGTRELLSESWRWLSALQQHVRGGGDESLVQLAFSLFERIERALASRDAIHQVADCPQHRDTQRETLSHLDSLLVDLMGSVDIAARVAHVVLGFPLSEMYRASWQTHGGSRWLDRVRGVSPALAAVVVPGMRGHDALKILRLLRNSVHGSVLEAISVQEAGRPMRSLVGIPDVDEPEVIAAMERLSGQQSWGGNETIPGRIHLEPDIFVDRLFDEVIVLVNSMLANMPVESLTNVALSPEDRLPPTVKSGQTSFFEPSAMKSIRWQLGF